jgi:hypothetical protein
MCGLFILIPLGLWLMRGKDIVIGSRAISGRSSMISGVILLLAGFANLGGAILRAMVNTNADAPSTSGLGLLADLGSIAYLILAAAGLVFLLMGYFSASPAQSSGKGGIPVPNDPESVYCPKCKFEQWNGYTECQKCGTKFA